jgi:hypothetical protein
MGLCFPRRVSVALPLPFSTLFSPTPINHPRSTTPGQPSPNPTSPYALLIAVSVDEPPPNSFCPRGTFCRFWTPRRVLVHTLLAHPPRTPYSHTLLAHPPARLDETLPRARLGQLPSALRYDKLNTTPPQLIDFHTFSYAYPFVIPPYVHFL